jgi:hypothetical protein
MEKKMKKSNKKPKGKKIVPFMGKPSSSLTETAGAG